MLEKLVLVVYMLVSRSEIQVQYTTRFQTEAQCQTEAKKATNTDTWATFPVKRAECTFDLTKPIQAAPIQKGK